MFSIGDLVTQKSFASTFLSDAIKESLNMGLVGIVLEIKTEVHPTSSTVFHNMVLIRWSSGQLEKLPEGYLEKVLDST